MPAATVDGVGCGMAILGRVTNRAALRTRTGRGGSGTMTTGFGSTALPTIGSVPVTAGPSAIGGRVGAGVGMMTGGVSMIERWCSVGGAGSVGGGGGSSVGTGIGTAAADVAAVQEAHRDALLEIFLGPPPSASPPPAP